MKRTIALAACALLALGASSAYAAPKAGDARAIAGSYKATAGRYSDGTTEEDIDMTLAFTATTMSDPMSKSGEVHSYELDEKGKATSIIGPGETAMFASLDFAKQ